SGWFKGNGQRRSDDAEDRSTGPTDEPAGAPASGATSGTASGSTSGATTSSATTGGGSDQEPVIVWEAANRLEAQIVAGRLQSEGIPAFLLGESLGPIYGLTTGSLAATVVLVPAPLAAKALEILNTDVDWDESADDPDRGAEPL
ncbi:MAG TPA: DUF2007 domain-containing protein, partial [Caldilineaceae bacterium]|nr:DUF2007 domain-containing protein [Caldilineaceae bacterium]